MLRSAALALLIIPLAASAADELKLWYKRPAAEWVEALPVGNGRLGAMVFGGIEQERIQLNEGTLWAGGPTNPANPDAKAALPEIRRLLTAGEYQAAQDLVQQKFMSVPVRQAPYETVGDLMITMAGEDRAQDYRRELDLDSALALTRFTAAGTTFTREVLVSPVDQVIAVRLSADRPGAISCDVALRSPQPDAATRWDGRNLVLSGRNAQQDAIAGALRFEARLAAVLSGGQLQGDDERLSVRAANEVTLLLAIATSYRRFDDTGGDPAAISRRQLASARGKGFARIAAGRASAGWSSGSLMSVRRSIRGGRRVAGAKVRIFADSRRAATEWPSPFGEAGCAARGEARKAPLPNPSPARGRGASCGGSVASPRHPQSAPMKSFLPISTPMPRNRL